MPISHRENSKPVQYSKNLIGMINDIGEFLYKENLGGFIRDYESLPERSGFDIDIILDMSKEAHIKNIVIELAASRGLLITLIPARTGVRRVIVAFVIDATNPLQPPDYLFIEMHGGVVSPHFKLPIEYSDMEFVFEKGLPVPTSQWQDLMLFRKALKKRAFDIPPKLIQRLSENKLYGSIFKYSPEEAIGKEKVRDLKVESGKRPAWMESLARNVFLFTPLKKEQSFLFSIQGPDGVGKSTVIDELIRLFSALPINLNTFHHMSSSKENVNSSQRAILESATQDEKSENVPLHRVFLRFSYRFLPRGLKQYWLNFLAYSMYTTNINRQVHAGWESSTVFLCDRYFDDRYMKMHMNSPKDCTPWLGWIFGRIIERPKISFLLLDEPKNIIARKQELTIDEIEQLSKLIEVSIVSRAGNLHKLSVTDQSARDVAITIFQHIILSLDTDILSIIKSWKHDSAI